MLYEIICDKFKKKKIIFHEGLNTVLGDDIGSNSIGKSTFLMIIDFVFGGKDYIMLSTDIQRNVGRHLIKFCFIFENKKFYFSRDTNDLEFVNKCDEQYNTTSIISLDEFCLFLKNRYSILLEDISFRNIVGRFSRIYGKENLDEKQPLNIVHNERSGEPTNALLKLFNLYKYIAELDFLLKHKESELKAYKNAQKYEFISSIGKRKYKTNEKELVELNKEKEQIPIELDSNLLDLDSVKVEELLKLKNNFSIAKRHRSRLYSQLQVIDSSLEETKVLKTEKFEELLKFFPDASIRTICEIEEFHKEIRQALKSELKQKKAALSKLIGIAQGQIDELERSIKEITQCSNLSKVILIKYSNVQKRIEYLLKENESFNKLESLSKAKTDAKERRDKMKLEQLNKLQELINTKMKEINDYIYSNKKKPPVIIFDGNQYTFFTMDDTGTGTSYKSMVVYDLSILELTPLPILIHDSVVLKQISDIAIEKILEKYMMSHKQIFISFDKIAAYTPKSQNILKSNEVLELSVGGQELFGRSWNDR